MYNHESSWILINFAQPYELHFRKKCNLVEIAFKMIGPELHKERPRIFSSQLGRTQKNAYKPILQYLAKIYIFAQILHESLDTYYRVIHH